MESLGLAEASEESTFEIRLPGEDQNCPQLSKEQLVACLAEAGHDISNCQVLYWDSREPVYIFAGLTTKGSAKFVVPIQWEQAGPHRLQLKCRHLNEMAQSSARKLVRRKGDERRIDCVVTSLWKWKKLLEKGMSKKQAARLVNVSDKTLDYYAGEVRYGREHGFDFCLNARHQMRTLRHFNQAQKPPSNPVLVPEPEIESRREEDDNEPQTEAQAKAKAEGVGEEVCGEEEMKEQEPKSEWESDSDWDPSWSRKEALN